MTASRSTSALVDVEIYDPAGRRVARRSWDRLAFSANHVRTLRWSWYVSSTRKLGAYTIKVGVFRPGWTKLLAWTSRARTIRIVR